jgi:peptidoglycan DL-endopeptidase CwlO
VPHQPRTMSSPARALLVAGVATAALVAGVTVVAADPRQTLDEVRTLVDELHADAAEANERHNIAAESLVDAQRRVTRAEEDVARQEDRLVRLTSEVGGFAAAAYRAGGMDPTVGLLFAEDTDQFLRHMSTVDAFATQQAEQLASVANLRSELENKRLSAEEERSRFAVVEAALSEEKETVEKLLVEQERVLTRLTADQRRELQLEQQRTQQAAHADREAAATRLSRAQEPDAGSTVSAASASGRAASAVQSALSKVGNAYSYGASGPSAFDCSGFTGWAWGQAGVSLPRSSSAQFGHGQPVSSSQLQPGDLLFYGSPISHVAMYIGDGMVVHASNPRTGVTTAPAMQAGGSRKPFVGAKRPG